MNRQLVEAGVDPDRLATRAVELCPDWVAHLDQLRAGTGCCGSRRDRARLRSDTLELTLPAQATGPRRLRGAGGR